METTVNSDDDFCFDDVDRDGNLEKLEHDARRPEIQPLTVLNRMWNSEEFCRLYVRGRDEALGHGIDGRGFDPAHPGPTVSLIRFDHPQVFILIHTNTSLAGH